MMATKETLPEGTDTVIDEAANDEAKSAVVKAKERIRDEAGQLKEQATGKAREYATTGKDRATGTLKDVSAAMDDAAKSVDERLGENYGEYARWAANAVATFADRLDGKEVDDLVRDAEEFVRKSPVVAIGVAAVAGFAIARLIKSGIGNRDDA